LVSGLDSRSLGLDSQSAKAGQSISGAGHGRQLVSWPDSWILKLSSYSLGPNGQSIKPDSWSQRPDCWSLGLNGRSGTPPLLVKWHCDPSARSEGHADSRCGIVTVGITRLHLTLLTTWHGLESSTSWSLTVYWRRREEDLWGQQVSLWSQTVGLLSWTVGLWHWTVGLGLDSQSLELDDRSIKPDGYFLDPDSRSLGWTISLWVWMLGLWGQNSLQKKMFTAEISSKLTIQK